MQRNALYNFYIKDTMKTEIKIVVFEPAETGKFAADIYVDDCRWFCGRGGIDFTEALNDAIEWIEQNKGIIKDNSIKAFQ